MTDTEKERRELELLRLVRMHRSRSKEAVEFGGIDQKNSEE
jgi:hypothetical protein